MRIQCTGRNWTAALYDNYFAAAVKSLLSGLCMASGTGLEFLQFAVAVLYRYCKQSVQIVIHTMKLLNTLHMR